MLEAAHRRDFDVVIVWALDRLGHSMFETIPTVQKLDRAGVEILSAREPWLDTAGPARSLLLSIFEWVAEQEHERIVEGARAGMVRGEARRHGDRAPKKAISLSSVRALRAQGLSVRAVARRLKVSASTLRGALKRAGETAERSATPGS